MFKKINFRYGGWTFVETIVVMTIVMILSASVGFSCIKQIDKAKCVAAKSQIEAYSLGLDSFYLDTGVYPESYDGLSALCFGYSYSNWNGPYISKSVSKDPWGNDYVYSFPGENGFPYSIVSYGRDGIPGGSGFDEDIFSNK